MRRGCDHRRAGALALADGDGQVDATAATCAGRPTEFARADADAVEIVADGGRDDRDRRAVAHHAPRRVTDERGTVREFFRTSGFAERGRARPDRWAAGQHDLDAARRRARAARRVDDQARRRRRGRGVRRLRRRPAGLRHRTARSSRCRSRSACRCSCPPGVRNGFQATCPTGGCQYLYCFDAEWPPGHGRRRRSRRSTRRWASPGRCRSTRPTRARSRRRTPRRRCSPSSEGDSMHRCAYSSPAVPASSAPTSCTTRVAAAPRRRDHRAGRADLRGQRAQPRAGARPRSSSSTATSPTPRSSTRWSRGSRPRRALRGRVAQRQLAARPVAVRAHQPGRHVHAARGGAPARRALHHISTDEVYGDLELDDPREVHARHAVQPVQPVQLDQGRLRPAGARLGALVRRRARRSRTARTTTARTSTSRSSSRARSPTSSTACGPSSTAPARTCATGSTSTTTTRAVWAIIDRGRLGETYLIGADGEHDNKNVVEAASSRSWASRRRVRPRHRPRRATTCATRSTRPSCATSWAGRRGTPTSRRARADRRSGTTSNRDVVAARPRTPSRRGTPRPASDPLAGHRRAAASSAPTSRAAAAPARTSSRWRVPTSTSPTRPRSTPWSPDARPDVVVNAAAYTAVDAAETDEATPRSRSTRRARGCSPTALARHGGRLVHVSTDYVFAGDATAPYEPDDPTGPRTRLRPHQARRRAGGAPTLPDASLRRPLGVGLRRARRRTSSTRCNGWSVSATPSTSSPTRSARPPGPRSRRRADRARRGRRRAGPGVLHSVNAGQASWFDLAREAFRAGRRRPGAGPARRPGRVPAPGAPPGVVGAVHDIVDKPGLTARPARGGPHSKPRSPSRHAERLPLRSLLRLYDSRCEPRRQHCLGSARSAGLRRRRVRHRQQQGAEQPAQAGRRRLASGAADAGRHDHVEPVARYRLDGIAVDRTAVDGTALDDRDTRRRIPR